MKTKKLGYFEFVFFSVSLSTIMVWVFLTTISFLIPNLSILDNHNFVTSFFLGIISIFVIFSSLFFMSIRFIRFNTKTVIISIIISILTTTSFYNYLNFLMLITLCIVYAITLSQWFVFFDMYRISVKKMWVTKTLLIVSMLIIIVGSIMHVINKRINDRRSWFSAFPEIKKVEPLVVFPSTKVVVYGVSFGWANNEYTSPVLMSDHGVVRTDLWTNEKLIFTVPFRWNGDVRLWVERFRDWRGKRTLMKGNVVTIKVLDGDNLSAHDEKLYYKSIQNLSDETKMLNGW